MKLMWSKTYFDVVVWIEEQLVVKTSHSPNQGRKKMTLPSLVAGSSRPMERGL